mmetsp:Transcript_19632/g.37151  ORF Transcript_19632/g.37151 Transcript_19632/m.37151 type:complete len:205 (-) Transcript_19632:162-776(-)
MIVSTVRSTSHVNTGTVLSSHDDNCGVLKSIRIIGSRQILPDGAFKVRSPISRIQNFDSTRQERSRVRRIFSTRHGNVLGGLHTITAIKDDGTVLGTRRIHIIFQNENISRMKVIVCVVARRHTGGAAVTAVVVAPDLRRRLGRSRNDRFESVLVVIIPNYGPGRSNRDRRRRTNVSRGSRVDLLKGKFENVFLWQREKEGLHG